ncbi:MAG TPA: patatin-like phospholipase family protein [Steroidobacteraceae bacterium]|nr:patatin-like phospholipase family protein [Steroidobacteraceae bacterium]
MTGAGAAGPRIALMLPGGGARSAWQVGVLNAIAAWYPPGATLPFQVLCGTSAGAINATVLAAHADDFHRGASELARVWAGFRVGQVFRAGTLDMLRSGLHLALALASGGWLLPVPRALLDNSPLRALLARNVDFARLRRTIAAGQPEALAISATSLTRGESVTFVESARPFPAWDRAARRGVPASLRIDHLMASAAVPFMFPPVQMEGAHFSDGALRQTAPLAPAIHLGAERILVIGVRHRGAPRAAAGPPPNMAEQFGFMLDALFMEGMHADLERLHRVNTLLAHARPGPAPLGMRHVDALLLQPEDDPSEAALANQDAMPGALSSLLRVLGARGARGGRLLSFLLFESGYTRALIAAGERDAGRRRAEISAFLGLDAALGARID